MRRRRSRPRFAPLGPFSEGTLNPDDLVPADLAVLAECKPRLAARYQREADAADACECDGEQHPEHDKLELLSELQDALDNLAPPFAYFGSHEGDGACFGFWVSWDSLAESIADGEVLRVDNAGYTIGGTIGGSWTHSETFKTYAEIPAELRRSWRYRLTVSDHGNAALYYRNGREVWSIV